jgi:hypothetical protein
MVKKLAVKSLDGACSLIVAIILLTSVHAFAKSNRCANLFQEGNWSPEIYSDPNQHDSSNFRYLVHTIPAEYFMRPARIKDWPHKPLTKDVRPILNEIFRNPKAIANIPALSASLISPNRRGTAGGFGFILKAPQSTVVSAWHHDMAAGLRGASVNGIIDQRLHQLKEKYGLLSPQEILEATYPTSYNEVVLRGRYKTDELEIVGVFVITQNGVPAGWKADRDRLFRFAQRNNLPVIYIEGIPSE